MRPTKQQIRVIDELKNGGHIWTAGSCAYLACRTPEGHYKSNLLHGKVFTALLAMGVITKALSPANTWRLK